MLMTTAHHGGARRRRWPTPGWPAVLSFGVPAAARTITVTRSSNRNDNGGPTGSGVYDYPDVLIARAGD